MWNRLSKVDGCYFLCFILALTNLKRDLKLALSRSQGWNHENPGYISYQYRYRSTSLLGVNPLMQTFNWLKLPPPGAKSRSNVVPLSFQISLLEDKVSLLCNQRCINSGYLQFFWSPIWLSQILSLKNSATGLLNYPTNSSRDSPPWKVEDSNWTLSKKPETSETS